MNGASTAVVEGILAEEAGGGAIEDIGAGAVEAGRTITVTAVGPDILTQTTLRSSIAKKVRRKAGKTLSLTASCAPAPVGLAGLTSGPHHDV